MNPESVTVLALAALALAGCTVAVTGVIHLRRAKAEERNEATSPAGDAAAAGSADVDEGES